jgi:predicted permease
MLSKNRGVTLIAVLTLALGVGANTTMFSWVSAVLLNPMPGALRPEEIVTFSPASATQAILSVSYPNFVDFRDRNDVLAGLIVTDLVAVSLGGVERSERAWGQLVSANFFDVLGVPMQAGRGFIPEEDKAPMRDAVVVISDGLWERRFSRDPRVVGQTLLLNNRPFAIIGVASPEFQGTYTGLGLDLYVPIMMQEVVLPGGSRLQQRGNSWLDSWARLKPGVSRQQAEAALNGLAQQMGREFPETAGMTVSLLPLWNAQQGATSVLGPVLIMLLAVAGVVLLIACANIANLLMARAAGRRREIAVRLSLGAGRARLVRQLLTESLMLAVMGSALGVLLTLWTSGLLAKLAPPTGFPVHLNPSVDDRVLLFALGVCVITAVLFGLAPALQSTRSDVSAALKEEAGSVSSSKGRGRMRRGLAVAQVSLSMLLLVAAGLFLRSIVKAQTFDPGFNPHSVLLTSMDLFTAGYDRARGMQFQQQLLDRVAAIPGVESVTLARRVPLGLAGRSSTGIEVEGYQPAKDETVWSYLNNVGPDYFRTMQIPIRRGRDFQRRDAPESQRVVIINEALARRYWKGREPVGTSIGLGEEKLTVVGVVGDSKFRQLNEAPMPFFYLPLTQYYRSDVTLHARTSGDPAASTAAVRAAVASLDSSLALFDVRPLDVHIQAASFQQRMSGTLLAVFGALALVLAAIGIYGVIVYGVAQRAREIGIRVALGAQRRDVAWLILSQGLRLALAGIGVGLVAATAAMQGVRTLLFGVSAFDPLTYLAVSSSLATVALLACWIPARRATRIDPMVALRYE